MLLMALIGSSFGPLRSGGRWGTHYNGGKLTGFVFFVSNEYLAPQQYCLIQYPPYFGVAAFSQCAYFGLSPMYLLQRAEVLSEALSPKNILSPWRSFMPYDVLASLLKIQWISVPAISVWARTCFVFESNSTS